MRAEPLALKAAATLYWTEYKGMFKPKLVLLQNLSKRLSPLIFLFSLYFFGFIFFAEVIVFSVFAKTKLVKAIR